MTHPPKSPASLDDLRAAQDPLLDADTARELAGAAPMVRLKLAASSACPLDVLATLAMDPDSTVRVSALANLLSRDCAAYLPAVSALSSALLDAGVPVDTRARIVMSHLVPSSRTDEAMSCDSRLSTAVSRRSGKLPELALRRPPRPPMPGHAPQL